MRRLFKFCTFVMVLAFAWALNVTPTMGRGARGLATITGTVRDNKGAPLGGALIQLIREGAKQAIKQTYSGADGSFSAKIPAGRYSLRAIAQGFSEVLFESVQVNPSAEIAYRFNLEPVNSPRTLVNQRSDRDNVKWTLRSAQSQRSIFQANEGEDSTIAAVERANDPNTEVTETASDERGRVRLQGVAETYFATSSGAFSSAYEGVNFALALPASETIDLIFAGQSGIGADAPQRFETTARLRLDDRHRLSLSGGGARLFNVSGGKSSERNRLGQVSVRAIDEWIVV
jgi:hypothetical protein